MKIIINADDFGMTKSVNRAIFEIAKVGSLTSTTVMVNMPYAHEAKELLDLNISIGLHFNLTEGKAISDPSKISTLVDAEGNFLGKPELVKRISAGKVKVEHVLTEMESQYNKLYEIIGDRLDHMDSHQGLNKLSVVSKALLKFGKMKKIPAIRVYTKYYIKKKGDSYSVKFPGLTSFREFGIKRVLVETFLKYRVGLMNQFFSHPDGLLVAPSHNAIDVFKSLAVADPKKFPNVLVEVPFHPATDLSELGNTKLMQERIDEYEFLTSPAFIDAKKNLNLVTYSATF
jgi:chitin disaccharide deacetylase